MLNQKKWIDFIFDGYIFKFGYLLLTFFSFNSFLYYQPFMKHFIIVAVLYGVLCILYRILHINQYKKTPFIILAGLFLVSYVLTMFLNMHFGLRENIEGLVWLSFLLILLYIGDTSQDNKEITAQFKQISIFFIILATCSFIISLGTMIAGYSNIFQANDSTTVIQGFAWGRLWGAFSDPNRGATIASISIMLCLYFFTTKKHLLLRVLLLFSILLAFFYLVLSDSRTGLLTLICAVFFWTFIKISLSHAANLNWWKRIFILILSVLIAVGAGAAIQGGKIVYNQTISYLTTHNNISYMHEENTQIEREYGDDVDISNRRFELWESGLSLFKTAPITGVGFRNILPATQERVPDAYSVNNSYTQFNAFHNMWVDILASQGIIGFVIFFPFILGCAIKGFKLLGLYMSKGQRDDGTVLCSIIATIIICLVSAFVQSDVVFVNTPIAVIFWIFLGFAMNYKANQQQNDYIK